MPVEKILIPSAGFQLSALLARAEGHAKGLIVALPGGGYGADYWHCETLPGASFLNLARDLGYTVLALDRPGYGASANLTAACLPLADQVDVIFDAVENWRLSEGSVGRVFVTAHSLGGVIAIGMASSERGRMLSAVDVSGVPLKFSESNIEEIGSWPTAELYVPPIPDDVREWLFFGPETTYDANAFAYDCAIVRPMPTLELLDGRRCPRTLPSWMAAVAVPIQYTMAAFERSSETGPEILDMAKRLFAASPRAVTHLQMMAGHNISLHRVARAHHLRTLAFFDEHL